MRIIAGEYRGRKLAPVSGVGIRPTADRLRESIFNIISYRVRDCVVLDLFAGTGALGLEALSRGGCLAVFVDKLQRSVAIIERNIKSCALEEKTRIFRWDIRKNLNCIRGFRPAFNLVFMDPPYNSEIIGTALNNLDESNSLEKGALIIVEHSVMKPFPERIGHFTASAQRKYGKTLVSILSYMV